MRDYTAIITVREYDKILPNKNLLPINGVTLLENKLRQIADIKSINKILVSSESDNLLNIAAVFNKVEVRKRPIELANCDSCFNKLVEHISLEFDDIDLLWVSVTSPLISKDIYENALSTYEDGLDQGYDSLVSVIDIKRNVLDNNGPLNFKKDTLPSKRPDFYQLAGGISIANSNNMKKWGYNWGPNPFRFKVPVTKAIDICDMDDYQMACKLSS